MARAVELAGVALRVELNGDLDAAGRDSGVVDVLDIGNLNPGGYYGRSNQSGVRQGGDGVGDPGGGVGVVGGGRRTGDRAAE